MVKKVFEVPITSKPITASSIRPLSCLYYLRDNTKDEKVKAVIQSMIDEITGKIRYEKVAVDFEEYNSPIIPTFLRELEKRC